MMEQEREEGKKLESFWAQPEKRINLLVSLMIALTVVFVFFAMNSPEGSTLVARWKRIKQERENEISFQKALSQDPEIGSPISQFQLSSFLPIRQKSLVLVVVFGGCEGCGAQSLDEWAEVLGEWERIKREIEGILVIRESEGKLKEVKAKKGWEVKVFADSEGEISKGLNAFFSPRAYGFVDGKLAWVQKRVGMGIVEILEENLKLAMGDKRAKQILNEWSLEMRERVWGISFRNAVRGERL